MLLAGGLLVLAVPITVVGQDRTEVRASTTTVTQVDAAGATTAPDKATEALDVETDPLLHIEAKLPKDDTLGLTLLPRIVVPQIPQVKSIDYIAAGSVDLRIARRAWTFTANEFAFYGDTSQRTLTIQPLWSGQGLPPVPFIVPLTTLDRIQLLSSNTNGALRYQITKHVANTVSGTYSLFGGATPELRQSGLPLVLTTSGEDSLEVQPSRANVFTSRVQVAYTRFRGPTPALAPARAARVDQKWEHRYGPLSKTSLQVGAVVTDQTTTGTRLFPIAEGVATLGFRQREAHAQAIFVARVAPAINPLSGDLQQRAEGQLALTYTLGRGTLRAQATILDGIPDKQVETRLLVLAGEIAYVRTLSEAWTLDTGVRGSREIFQAVNADRGTLTAPMAFVGLTYQWRGTKL